MRTKQSLISNFRLFRQCLLLGFFLTPVTAVGQAPDFEEMLEAASQGEAYAQYNLGLMYYRGQGAPVNYVTAYAWWNIASASGNESASGNRAIVEEQMTSAQIAEAQKLSTKIFDRIQQGN